MYPFCLVLGSLDDIHAVVQVVLLDPNASREITKKRATNMISGSTIPTRRNGKRRRKLPTAAER
jgi:hypothetical protein